MARLRTSSRARIKSKIKIKCRAKGKGYLVRSAGMIFDRCLLSASPATLARIERAWVGEVHGHNMVA